MKIAMIGCGKLGLPCAEVMATKHDVVGYDITPLENPRIRMVTSLKEAVIGADIVFVAVPTPHDPRYGGEAPIIDLPPVDFNYLAVESVLGQINKHVVGNTMVVLISTILPGTTRSRLAPILTNSTLIYNPYLIAMGSVKQDMINPECLIIGTSDGRRTDGVETLIRFYQTLMVNDPRVNVGTWDEAESIKIFYNTFISMKISMVNMIMDVAERNGNINVDVVTDALKAATQRITGPRYLTAGMGDAGGCHPRDNIALRWLANKLDLGYDLFHAIMGARDEQARNLAKKLVSLSIKSRLPIVIHGKAYKPYVPYTEGSYSLLVGHFIGMEGVDVSYADPLTGDSYSGGPAVILLAHNPRVTYFMTGVDVTDQRWYFDIPPGSIIVDPWRSVDAVPGCKVIPYGNTRIINQ